MFVAKSLLKTCRYCDMIEKQLLDCIGEMFQCVWTGKQVLVRFGRGNCIDDNYDLSDVPKVRMCDCAELLSFLSVGSTVSGCKVSVDLEEIQCTIFVVEHVICLLHIQLQLVRFHTSEGAIFTGEMKLFFAQTQGKVQISTRSLLECSLASNYGLPIEFFANRGRQNLSVTVCKTSPHQNCSQSGRAG